MKNKAFIYILERNEIPFYVGKTTGTTRRKHKHYQKYGNDISLVVIDECENIKKVWKYWETFYIQLFKSWGFKLENQNEGGGGPSIYKEEYKQKMRKPRKEGTGRKISKTLRENNHSKYYTDEVRKVMSDKLVGISREFTKEHIKNMGISALKRARIVIQKDLEGNFIKEWESKGLAAKWIKEQTGKNSNITSQIKDCILGRQKTAFGYKWEYK